jgi:predicted membrane channel-forming protein YqfA (hemolysin III family)
MNPQIFFGFLAVLSYLVGPVMLVWGWLRAIKARSERRTIWATLSLTGLLFATASGAFAVGTIVMAEGGAFGRNHQLFHQFVKQGLILSLVGIVFSTAGMSKRSPLRWQAPAAAIATLAFWILATTWP